MWPFKEKVKEEYTAPRPRHGFNVFLYAPWPGSAKLLKTNTIRLIQDFPLGAMRAHPKVGDVTLIRNDKGDYHVCVYTKINEHCRKHAGGFVL